jgi:hypothetical protein
VSPTYLSRSGERALGKLSIERQAKGIALLTSRFLPDPASAHLNSFVQAIGLKFARERGNLAYLYGRKMTVEDGLAEDMFPVVNQRALERARAAGEPPPAGTKMPTQAERDLEQNMRRAENLDQLDYQAVDMQNWLHDNVVGALEDSGGKFHPDEELARQWAEDYGPDQIRWITRAQHKRLFGEFKPASQFMRRFIDQPTQLWRHLTLTFRPAWIVNNIVGNTLLYAMNHAFDGGSKGYARAVVDEARGRHDLMPAELRATGFVRAEVGADASIARSIRRIDSIRNATSKNPVRRWVYDWRGFSAAAEDVAYSVRRSEEAILHFNALTSDNIPRRASWYRIVENNMGWINRQLETNHSWEELVRELVRNAENPAHGDVRMHAIYDRLVNQVMKQQVDFSRMSDFERRTIRRIIPFYSWLRGMTAALAHFTWEHPGRAALLATVGKVQERELQQELGRASDVLRGALPLGKYGTDALLMATTLGLNPYATPAQVIGTGMFLAGKGESPMENPLLQTNPYLQVLISSVFQRDIFSGELTGHGPFGTFVREFANQFPPVETAQKVLVPKDAAGKAGDPHLTVPGATWHGIPLEVLAYIGVPVRAKNIRAAEKIVQQAMPTLERKGIEQADEWRLAKMLAEKIAGKDLSKIEFDGVPLRSLVVLDHRIEIAQELAKKMDPRYAAIRSKRAENRTYEEKVYLTRVNVQTKLLALGRHYHRQGRAAQMAARVGEQTDLKKLQHFESSLDRESKLANWHRIRTYLYDESTRKFGKRPQVPLRLPNELR